MQHILTIDICGTNSVLGTLYNSEFCDVIQMDGLTGLREYIKDKEVVLKCRTRDLDETKKQLYNLKLDDLIELTHS